MSLEELIESEGFTKVNGKNKRSLPKTREDVLCIVERTKKPLLEDCLVFFLSISYRGY